MGCGRDGVHQEKRWACFWLGEEHIPLGRKRRTQKSCPSTVCVSVGVHSSAESFKTVKKTQSHDRAMPYSNNRILMMRIIGIIEDQ